MNSRSRSAALLATTLGAFNFAFADTFVSEQEFLNANPGTTLMDFENIAPVGGLALVDALPEEIGFSGGQSFSTLNPNFVQVADRDNIWGDPGFSTPTDVVFVNLVRGFVMRLTFEEGVDAIGFLVNIGVQDNQSARVRAFTNGTLVGEQTLRTSNQFTTFIGFSDSRGIDRLDISAVSQNGGNFVLIDDLRLGEVVPDPGEPALEMEFVTVGNARNPPDENGFGQVDYNYRIAKHEVTNGQYVEFLNAVARSDPHGLYRETMATDARGGITRTGSSGNYQYAAKRNYVNKPVSYISFFDAARMANWIHNGRGSGDTETGAYDMTAPHPVRSPDAKVFIPTENEWYKAAFHDPTPGAGGGDNYWLYPTRSNSAPRTATTNGSGDVTNPGTNTANYNSGAGWEGLRGHVITVGSTGLESESFYGTSNQAGNVREWNETIINGNRRGLRGGAWNTGAVNLQATNRDYNSPDTETGLWGLRLAAAAPEVSISTPLDNITEGEEGTVPITISRTGETNLPLIVNISFGGSAATDTDYFLDGVTTSTATIPANAQDTTIFITSIDDVLDEMDENVTVTLRGSHVYNLALNNAVTIQILDDDFSPVAVVDTGYEVVEDNNLTVSAEEGVLANDTDIDNGDGPANLLAELVTGTVHGTLILNSNGSFDYTPDPDYFGSDSFTYVASDGTNLSDPVEVNIEVTELVDLILSVTRSREVVGAPGSVTHTISVENRGPSNATGAVIDLASIFPAGVTRDPLSPSTGAITGTQWMLGLAEGATATLPATYQVSPTARGGIDVITTGCHLKNLDQPLTNENDDSSSVRSNIVSPADIGTLELNVTPNLNLQNGLFTQQVSITNNNPLPLAGFRLLIDSLPADVQAYNSSGVTPGGTAFIESNNDLAPGESLTLTIEFFRPSLDPNFDPTFLIEALFSEDPPEPVAATDGTKLDPPVLLGNGDFLLEFSSTSGTTYAIEYSHDMKTWHRAVPAITANANRTQWIDSGPPKTASHPSTAPTRCYQVVTLSE